MSGATFFKRFANSLDVAGSVGRSAPTDPDHFLMVQIDVATSQQQRTLALQFFLPVGEHCAQHREALSGGYYIHMHSVPTRDSDGISPFARS